MNIGIIDIETTGFQKDNGHIVEIAIVSLNTETGDITESFSSVCKERGMNAKDREAWIFQNSTLTVEEVREAKTFDEIQGQVQDSIYAHDAVTAYNSSFDFGFLENRGLRIPFKASCPMLLSTPLCQLPGRMGDDYKWPKVEEAWKHFFPSRPYVELHRGLDDAMHEAKIIWQLCKLGLYGPNAMPKAQES